jgi:hypothetical protein
MYLNHKQRASRQQKFDNNRNFNNKNDNEGFFALSGS